ncbi:MAG: NAD(P)/FAD-dependent oxidoreductase [Candidatus Parcubacteria bacterium]|nr:NAD(P)/FAD-dependent oxidoreductase [Candidatus Parcubacteria bacterium]
MINVIILGGGFAGIRAALTLKEKNKSRDIEVTVIDKNSFHIFTPSLYEVATAEESQRNVVIPYKSILCEPLKFVEGKAEKIDVVSQKILLDGNREYKYDYLIFALGSDSADFGIAGIKEFGVSLKTLDDAIKIKNVLKTVRKVIVGGGGFSGTELACELITHREELEVTLIQGSSILLKELGDGVSNLAKKRLEDGGVKLVLGTHIKKVTREFVELEGGKTYPYDLFVWTGGVRSNNLLGKIEVDEMLQIKNLKNIFAAGDVVEPGVVPRAVKMGQIAAENVLRLIGKKSLLPYKYRRMGYMVPLGSHFATFAMGKYHVSGIFAYIIQQLIFLRYLLTIVSFPEAIRRFVRFEKNLK